MPKEERAEHQARHFHHGCRSRGDLTPGRQGRPAPSRAPSIPTREVRGSPTLPRYPSSARLIFWVYPKRVEMRDGLVWGASCSGFANSFAPLTPQHRGPSARHRTQPLNAHPGQGPSLDREPECETRSSKSNGERSARERARRGQMLLAQLPSNEHESRSRLYEARVSMETAA